MGSGNDGQKSRAELPFEQALFERYLPGSIRMHRSLERIWMHVSCLGTERLSPQSKINESKCEQFSVSIHSIKFRDTSIRLQIQHKNTIHSVPLKQTTFYPLLIFNNFHFISDSRSRCQAIANSLRCTEFSLCDQISVDSFQFDGTPGCWANDFLWTLPIAAQEFWALFLPSDVLVLIQVLSEFDFTWFSFDLFDFWILIVIWETGLVFSSFSFECMQFFFGFLFLEREERRRFCFRIIFVWILCLFDSFDSDTHTLINNSPETGQKHSHTKHTHTHWQYCLIFWCETHKKLTDSLLKWN